MYFLLWRHHKSSQDLILRLIKGSSSTQWAICMISLSDTQSFSLLTQNKLVMTPAEKMKYPVKKHQEWQLFFASASGWGQSREKEPDLGLAGLLRALDHHLHDLRHCPHRDGCLHQGQEKHGWPLPHLDHRWFCRFFRGLWWVISANWLKIVLHKSSKRYICSQIDFGWNREAMGFNSSNSI